MTEQSGQQQQPNPQLSLESIAPKANNKLAALYEKLTKLTPAEIPAERDPKPGFTYFQGRYDEKGKVFSIVSEAIGAGIHRKENKIWIDTNVGDYVGINMEVLKRISGYTKPDQEVIPTLSKREYDKLFRCKDCERDAENNTIRTYTTQTLQELLGDDWKEKLSSHAEMLEDNRVKVNLRSLQTDLKRSPQWTLL